MCDQGGQNSDVQNGDGSESIDSGSADGGVDGDAVGAGGEAAFATENEGTEPTTSKAGQHCR